MVRTLFSVVHGAFQCVVAMAVLCSLKNGAPS
jgi:hypothetical protein